MSTLSCLTLTTTHRCSVIVRYSPKTYRVLKFLRKPNLSFLGQRFPSLLNCLWRLQIARSSYSFLNADLFWPFLILHLIPWRHLIVETATCCLFTWCRWTETTRGAWEANAARDPLPIILNVLSISLATIQIQVHHAQAFSRAHSSPSCGHWRLLCCRHF